MKLRSGGQLLQRAFGILPLLLATSSLAYAGYVRVPPELRLPGATLPVAEVRQKAYITAQDRCVADLVSRIPKTAHVALVLGDDDWWLSLENELGANGLRLVVWATADWWVGDQQLLPSSLASIAAVECLGKTLLLGKA